MTTSTPVQQKERLQQAIQDNNAMIRQMQDLAQRTNNVELQSTLKEAAHHLEMAVQECNYASKATL